MKTRRGMVKLSGELVGVIEETGKDVTFEYLPQWLSKAGAVPVSLTLPLSEKPYVSKGLHPFFENLLPEGWYLEVASKKLRIAKADAFGLLLATCSDCVGAVEVEPAGAEKGQR